jgi:hypothetical protein
MQEKAKLREEMNYKKKTRKRTRKFEIDGVMVTTTTSKVVYGDDDDSLTNYYLNRKQELREFKLLQKQEQKQCQDLNLRAHIAFDAQVFSPALIITKINSNGNVMILSRRKNDWSRKGWL